MIFGQNRQELRQMYAAAWRKDCQGEPLSPLEAQIARVVAEHPEYQAAVAGDDDDDEYPPEAGRSNPYLHMGLHLAIREQVATDRPAGIRAVFQRLAATAGDPLAAEHRMLECLAEALWEAQSRHEAPNERKYLECLRQL
ncbi:MAG: DUF1841 family protein [Gammaproteobacteria bacterium]|nr:MAG: DUF1841 family protein [Gammaproteobacteria bacterium]